MPWRDLSLARKLALFGFTPATLIVIFSGCVQLITLLYILLAIWLPEELMISLAQWHDWVQILSLNAQAGLTSGFMVLVVLQFASWTSTHWREFPTWMRQRVSAILWTRNHVVSIAGSFPRPSAARLSRDKKISLFGFLPGTLLVLVAGTTNIICLGALSFILLPTGRSMWLFEMSGQIELASLFSRVGLNTGFVWLSTLSFLAWNTNRWSEWPERRREYWKLFTTQRRSILAPGLFQATLLVWISGVADSAYEFIELFGSPELNRSKLVGTLGVAAQGGLTASFVYISVVTLIQWMKHHWTEFPRWFRQIVSLKKSLVPRWVRRQK